MVHISIVRHLLQLRFSLYCFGSKVGFVEMSSPCEMFGPGLLRETLELGNELYRLHKRISYSPLVPPKRKLS